MPRAPLDPDDQCRAVFHRCGLTYGRHFCSTSSYDHAAHHLRIPNASVYTSDRVCCWRGDLDLADETDQRGLIDASKRLRRRLFVLREQTQDIRSQSKAWLIEAAIVTAWWGQITTSGYTKRLYGTLDQVIRRYQAPHR